jgi:hypothetical protein
MEPVITIERTRKIPSRNLLTSNENSRKVQTQQVYCRFLATRQKSRRAALVTISVLVESGKNEITATRLKIRPAAIKVRKDEVFTNARSSFPKEPLETLEQSIQDLGLLKQLCVERNPLNKDEFFLLAGERRHICVNNLIRKNAICRDAETSDEVEAVVLFEYIDVKIVSPKDDIERLAIMLAENGEHSPVPDWDYFNFALFLSGQKNEDGSSKYSRKALCRVFNKSSPWITHTLQLADLPARAKDCLKAGTLSRTAAIQLLSAKEEQVDFVLKYTESLVLEQARKDIEIAETLQRDTELDIEIATAESENAINIGDRIAAKMHARKIGFGKKILRGAVDKQERAKKTITKPLITDEAIKQTFENCPETLKDGVAAKPRSPKLFRHKVKEVKAILSKLGSSDYFTQCDTGKSYHTRDMKLIVAAWEQLLGKKPMDIFTLLDEMNASFSS